MALFILHVAVFMLAYVKLSLCCSNSRTLHMIWPTVLLLRNFCNVLFRYQASRDDLAVYSALEKAPSPKEYPHAARWYSHIEALLGQRYDILPADLI